MMDDRDLYPARSRRGLAGPAIALLLAFIVGIVLTSAAVRHWDRLALLLHPQPAGPAIAPPLSPQRFAAMQLPAPAEAAADPALTTRVATIEARIAAIDDRAQEARGDADRAEGLLVAFAARRAIDRGQPLGFLEGMLRAHFGGVDPQAVAMIVGAAQRPVTLIQLQESFAALGAIGQGKAAGDNWWSGLRRELGALVVIHKSDDPDAVPAERQARAAHALEQGRVDVALDEVARMPGASAAGGWIGAARRYVLARNALDRIETAALLKPPASGLSIEQDRPRLVP